MASHFQGGKGDHGTPLLAFLSDVLANVAKNGYYGVSMFFVISGFVISRMIVQRYGDLHLISVRDFYVRRAGRIWPLLLTTFAIGLAVVFNFRDAQIHTNSALYQIFSPTMQIFDVWFYLSSLTMTLNWLLLQRSGEYGLHWAILWSIAIEEQFYLLYPLLLRQGRGRTMLTVLLFLVGIGPIARWIGSFAGTNRAITQNSFAGYDLLAIGVLTFMLHRKYNTRLESRRLLSTSICAIGFCLMVLIYFLTDSSNFAHLVFAPSLLGISLSAFLLGGLALSRLETAIPSVLTSLGQFSYGMYLFHPVCLLVATCLMSAATGPIAFGAFLTLTAMLSVASFYMFEQPINRIICRNLTDSLTYERQKSTRTKLIIPTGDI
jgi:peptidoglycan/LPS O-acetylase OafA/YrhL